MTLLGVKLTNGRTLRLLEETDTDELHALIEANRAHLARWMPWAAGQTHADTQGFIRSSRRQLAENAGFQMALVNDGRIVGVAGFHGVDWTNRSASIGYWLAESEQGHGTVTETVRTLLDHAITTWHLNRVEIRAGVENTRSRAILERLGLRYEGTLAQAERIGDRYIDQVVYAALAEDWPLSTD